MFLERQIIILGSCDTEDWNNDALLICFTLWALEEQRF